MGKLLTTKHPQYLKKKPYDLYQFLYLCLTLMWNEMIQLR